MCPDHPGTPVSDICLFVITSIDEELPPSGQPAPLLGSANLQEVHSGAETVFALLPSGGPRPALWDPGRRVQRLLWREALEGSLWVLSPQKAPPAQPPLCPVQGHFMSPAVPVRAQMCQASCGVRGWHWQGVPWPPSEQARQEAPAPTLLGPLPMPSLPLLVCSVCSRTLCCVLECPHPLLLHLANSCSSSETQWHTTSSRKPSLTATFTSGLLAAFHGTTALFFRHSPSLMAPSFTVYVWGRGPLVCTEHTVFPVPCKAFLQTLLTVGAKTVSGFSDS